MSSLYFPDKGDVVWLELNPQKGHEQSGRRPALTVSPVEYNKVTGLALFCPITSQVKGYPFEVLIPDGLKAAGVVLSDQIKSLDWKSRKAKFICKLPYVQLLEVKQKLSTLLE